MPDLFVDGTMTPVIPQKRPRPVKSCLSCRTRKLKCDREQPCTQCVKNRHPQNCLYDERAGSMGRVAQTFSPSSSASRNSSKADSPEYSATNSGSLEILELRAQVSKLESLVQRLENPNHATISSQPQAFSLYPMEIDSQQTAKYLGLHNTRSLISLFPDAVDFVNKTVHDPNFKHEAQNLSRMFPKYKPPHHQYLVDLESILSLIPPKFICDQYLISYTNYFEPIYQILDISTFSQQYDHFWKTPESWTDNPSKVGFVTQLALISVIGSQLEPQTLNDSSDIPQFSFEPRKTFSVLSAWLSQIDSKTRVELDIIQSQCLFILAKRMLSYPCVELWRHTGDLLRSALVLDLHKDPLQLDPTMPSYQADARRRLWYTIASFDIEFSTASCMPSLLQTVQHTVRIPGIDETLMSPGGKPNDGRLPYHIAMAKSLPARLHALRVLTQTTPSFLELREAFTTLEHQHAAQSQNLPTQQECSRPAELFHIICLDMAYRRPMLLLRTLELQFAPRNDLVSLRSSISKGVAQCMAVMAMSETLDPGLSDHEAISDIRCWNAFQAFYDEDVIRAGFCSCFCIISASPTISDHTSLQTHPSIDVALDLPKSAVRRMIEDAIKSFILNKPDLRPVLKQLMGLAIVSELTKTIRTEVAKQKNMHIALDRVLHLCSERYAVKGQQAVLGPRQDSITSSNSFDFFMDQEFGQISSAASFDWNIDIFSDQSLQPSIVSLSNPPA